ncbi:MAG TPA: hypothetical protein VKM55_06960 [Candidatus Lokiarchaeia archaeon]|nr:hypothetical protein [Candidatus Lokiarchaeia archaeon]
MNIQIALTPSESKRLIAKGVVEYLKESLDIAIDCTVLITRGSTNAYVLDELLKYLEIDAPFTKADFITGEVLAEGNTRLWSNKHRKPEVVIKKREMEEVKDDAGRLKVVQRMKAGDVVIKGANAIDHTGMAGILVGDQTTGGTIGSLYGIIKSKGLDFICPVGLGKMVMGEISETTNIAGANFCKFSQGMPVGLFPVAANVITEIEALEMMFDCDVFHLASGGLGKAQGSVVLLIEAAEDEELDKIKAFLDDGVFGEEPLEPNPAE